MKKIIISILIGSALLSAGCEQDTHSSRGFSLPKGFAGNGELLFREFQCVQCHTVAGTEFEGGEWRAAENVGISVELGGAKSRIQTYEDLVTSIINPSHRIAKGYPRSQVIDEGETREEDESKMPVYNSIMTVDELADIVAFLEKQYTLQNYYETVYRYFEYPF